MSLAEYFETVEGFGILSTASIDGNVDTAIYGRPHVIDEQTLGFIMRDRLSYKNVSENPKACYMYMEKNQHYQGKRIYLSKTGQEDDQKKIKSMSRHKARSAEKNFERRFLVYFKVEHIRPLVGDK